MSTPNPLLSKVKLPGRVFALPSKGIFYKPGEVLAEHVQNGEIQVKPMSALTEIKMRSADLLISGKVIREVCQECAPEIINPDLLLSKDVDALFVFLVASTYGSQKSIRSIHSCEKAEPHDYMISLDQIIMNPHNECLAHKDMLYSVDLPNTQRVILKPVTFNDSLFMMTLRQEIARKEMNREQVSHAEIENAMVSDMMAVIEAVEDVTPDGKPVRITDRLMIAEWVRALSKKDTDMIAEAAGKSADWGFDFTIKLRCKDCGQEYNHDLELNPINFFSG